MDLAYLKAHPEAIERLLTHQRIRVTTLPGSTFCRRSRLTLDDGTDLFAKEYPHAPKDFFISEARGAMWLAEVNVIPVPTVVAATETMLISEWIPPGNPTLQSAEEFGRALASLHRYTSPYFGADHRGYIGSLPLDNSPSTSWSDFYISRRCIPFVKQARNAGTLSSSDLAILEKALARIPSEEGNSELPSRIHGDLWSGNVHYDPSGTGWLVDTAAAHGGHRETDLASLALFGAPYLEHLLGAYKEIYPLQEGWRERQGIHQLHLLLVHCVLFGRSYVPQLLQTAQAYV